MIKSDASIKFFLYFCKRNKKSKKLRKKGMKYLKQKEKKIKINKVSKNHTLEYKNIKKCEKDLKKKYPQLAKSIKTFYKCSHNSFYS